MADDTPTETVHCAECGHDVQPSKQSAASMLTGTVVTVQRCPGCESVLRTKATGL